MAELRGTHVPVLLERCLELLAPALGRGGPTVHVDATLGLGGHAEAVLAAIPETVLIGLDRDTEALAHARARLAPYADRIHLVHAVYDELPEVLAELGIDGIDGALFDLGVSSLQLDAADRGFAYAQDAPLDMRMDQTRGVTAEEVVNTYSHGDLARVLRVYGEEKFAGRVASAILRERERSTDHLLGPSGGAGPGVDSGRSTTNRGTPGKENVSGFTDRGKPRTGRVGDGATGSSGRARRSEAAWWCCPTTRWRTASPSRPSPPGRAAAVRSTSRSSCPGTGPTLRLLSRGAEPPTRGRGGRQPACRIRAAAGGGAHRPRRARAYVRDRPRTVPTVSDRGCTCPPDPARGGGGCRQKAGTRRARGRDHERQQARQPGAARRFARRCAARTAVGGPDHGGVARTRRKASGSRSHRRLARRRHRRGGTVPYAGDRRAARGARPAAARRRSRTPAAGGAAAAGAGARHVVRGADPGAGRRRCPRHRGGQHQDQRERAAPRPAGEAAGQPSTWTSSSFSRRSPTPRRRAT